MCLQQIAGSDSLLHLHLHIDCTSDTRTGFDLSQKVDSIVGSNPDYAFTCTVDPTSIALAGSDYTSVTLARSSVNVVYMTHKLTQSCSGLEATISQPIGHPNINFLGHGQSGIIFMNPY